MCNFFKKIICASAIAFMLFAGIAIWGGGGEKFRWLGEKAGGIIEKGTEKLGRQADNIRDFAKEKISRWAGEQRKTQEDK